MADLTQEILADKDKYPDDRKIVLGDGLEVTVGQMRNAYQTRASFTKSQESWLQKEREFQQREQQYQEAMQGLQAQLQQVAMAQQQGQQQPAAPKATDQYDPYADAYVGSAFRELREELKALKEQRERDRKEFEDGKQYVLKREYEGILRNLGDRYTTRYNPDGKGSSWDQQQFLKFVMDNQVPNLEVAYRAYTADQEAEFRARQAEEAGVERGRKAAEVPRIPFGRRRPAPKPKDLPETFQEVSVDQIAEDPDIQAAMAKDYGAE